jgi:hypothetical protein
MMANEDKHKVMLHEHRSGEGSSGKLEISTLEAYLNDDGDLVLEGYDLGKAPEMMWGDSDYEYWWTVKKADVPMVLLQLIKDKFDQQKGYRSSQFAEWLKEKGIPVDFMSWS